MRGTLWEAFEDFEADVVVGFTELMVEVIVSERVSAAGSKVSSMARADESQTRKEEYEAYMRLHPLRECLRRALSVDIRAARR